MKPLYDKNPWPKLAVYDIEATDWVNVVFLGHVDEIGNRKGFYSIAEYLAWLFSDEFTGTHVWAHWGGHYDHRFIVAYCVRQKWSWQTIQSGNLLIIIRIRHPNGKEISFCESARLMPDSVEKIGKTINLRKLDVDRGKIENLTKAEVEEYCMRDCDIVLLGLKYMRDIFDSVGADFAYTLASISTRWVRRSDVLEWIKFYEQNDFGRMEYSKSMLQADDFCLPAYFGGRVEVYKTGKFKRNLYYYDITSSYPWSMTFDLPTYFKGFFAPPKDINDALSYTGISEATVFIPRGLTYIPILPIRYKGKLLFPEGQFRGRWTNLELMALWERGRNKGLKIKIHGQARFEELPFLKPFVDTFYNLRKIAKEEKDEFRSYTYKILLNSLYGKLVENVERKSILYGDMVSEAIKEYGPQSITATATPGIYALNTTSLGPFRHVAAGSYVTARSRLRLLEGMETCIKSGGKIYYCDTDSIVTDKYINAFEELDKNALGCFKLEHELSEAEFVCPKVYRYRVKDTKEDYYKVKGMPIKSDDPREKRLRWDIYNYHISKEAKERVDKLRLSPEQFKKYSSKEGIAGFMTDLNKGVIDPRKQLLQRQMKNEDSKRVHLNGDSTPIFMDGTYG